MRQVSSRSMGASTPMPTPCAALLGTARRGPATRAIAALGLERAGATRREGWAERSDGPCGCSPLWLRLWRGGCGVSMGVEAPMLRGLTRRGCSNGAAQQRSEFCGAPRKRTATGLPRSAAQGSQTWGRVLCFLSCTSKKGSRPPGRVPASNIQTHDKDSKKRAASAFQASQRAQFHLKKGTAPSPVTPPGLRRPRHAHRRACRSPAIAAARRRRTPACARASAWRPA